jgi:hypothetical protein
VAQPFGALNANVKQIGRQPGWMMMLAAVEATRTRDDKSSTSTINCKFVTSTKGFVAIVE